MAGTQIPIEPTSIAVDGAISGAVARWIVPLFYGRSYRDFEDKLRDSYKKGKPGALSFGHDIQGIDTPSYVNLEILYAWDENLDQPKVMVHLSSRR